MKRRSSETDCERCMSLGRAGVEMGGAAARGRDEEGRSEEKRERPQYRSVPVGARGEGAECLPVIDENQFEDRRDSDDN